MEFAGNTMAPTKRGYLASGSDKAPEDQPEVTRELTMIRGILDGVRRVTDELAMQLGPILRESEPNTVPHLSESFPISSPLAEELHAIYQEIRQIESKLNDTRWRLAI